MPNETGRFHLYSDTSRFANGSALYQIQNGKPKLIAYATKWLPEAAKSYSITELELCGLAINIASFSHLLKRVDFDAIVDHLALMHIIKSKTEPATTTIKRSKASNLSQKIPGRMEIETRKTNHMHTKDLMHSINNANDKMANNNPLIPDVAIHPGPVYRTPPKTIKQNMTHAQGSQSSNIDNNNSDTTFDFEENCPFQESVISKTFSKNGQIIFSGTKRTRRSYK